MTLALAPPRGRLSVRLDPRIKALLVLATSITVMSPGGDGFLPAALALGMLLAANERARRRLALLPTVTGVLALVAYLLPAAVRHPVSGAIAVAALYLMRFTVIGGVAMHLSATTTPGELTAALRASRFPRAITVSGAVMLRFLPVMIAEAGAVVDAMRLRGLTTGRGLLRHPILGIESFTVPLIASSLRAGEDLSASALLRGLGGPVRPTSLRRFRLGAADAVCLAVVAVLAVATVAVPGVL